MFPEITRDDVFRLETARLWLRWPVDADADAIAAFAGRKDVAEMTAQVPHPYPKGEASKRVDRWRSKNASGLGLKLVLTRRAAARAVVGLVGLDPTPAGVALGVMVSPDHAGVGLATEASHAVVDIAFLLTDVPRIEAAARVTNPAGRRILEKCGFRYEGTALQRAPARGGMIPTDRFLLDRKTWASLKGWRMPHLPTRTSGRESPASADGPVLVI